MTALMHGELGIETNRRRHPRHRKQRDCEHRGVPGILVIQPGQVADFTRIESPSRLSSINTAKATAEVIA